MHVPHKACTDKFKKLTTFDVGRKIHPPFLTFSKIPGAKWWLGINFYHVSTLNTKQLRLTLSAGTVLFPTHVEEASENSWKSKRQVRRTMMGESAPLMTVFGESVPLMTLFLGLVVIVIIVCYKWRWKIRHWYYCCKTQGRRVQLTDYNYLNDAVISYQEQTDSFISLIFSALRNHVRPAQPLLVGPNIIPTGEGADPRPQVNWPPPEPPAAVDI